MIHGCHRNRMSSQCWRLPALVTLNAVGQGTIVYERLYTPDSTPHIFPWDDQGMRLWGSQTTPATYGMDLNHDGINDFTFESGQHFGVSSGSLNAVKAFSSGSGFSYLMIPHQAGDLISDDAGPYEWTDQTSVFTASRDSGIIGQPPLTIGYFTGVESAFAALRFQIAGQTHYGWVRVGAPIVGINGGWIYDFAYETRANTPILAGAGVPEPASPALLVFGIAALLFQRKRPSAPQAARNAVGEIMLAA
jgi:hypothetical protein